VEAACESHATSDSSIEQNVSAYKGEYNEGAAITLRVSKQALSENFLFLAALLKLADKTAKTGASQDG